MNYNWVHRRRTTGACRAPVDAPPERVTIQVALPPAVTVHLLAKEENDSRSETSRRIDNPAARRSLGHQWYQRQQQQQRGQTTQTTHGPWTAATEMQPSAMMMAGVPADTTSAAQPYTPSSGILSYAHNMKVEDIHSQDIIRAQNRTRRIRGHVPHRKRRRLDVAAEDTTNVGPPTMTTTTPPPTATIVGHKSPSSATSHTIEQLWEQYVLEPTENRSKDDETKAPTKKKQLPQRKLKTQSLSLRVELPTKRDNNATLLELERQREQIACYVSDLDGYMGQPACLLVGPPGCGKTSVLQETFEAHPERYSYMELDCSLDARSAKTLKTLTNEALSGHSSLITQQRILVLEEIDGLYRGGIGNGLEALHDLLEKQRTYMNRAGLILSEGCFTEKSKRHGITAKRKEAKKMIGTEPLHVLTPIFMTCNSLAGLHSILPYVRVIHFKGLSFEGLVRVARRILQNTGLEFPLSEIDVNGAGKMRRMSAIHALAANQWVGNPFNVTALRRTTASSSNSSSRRTNPWSEGGDVRQLINQINWVRCAFSLEKVMRVEDVKRALVGVSGKDAMLTPLLFLERCMSSTFDELEDYGTSCGGANEQAPAMVASNALALLRADDRRANTADPTGSVMGLDEAAALFDHLSLCDTFTATRFEADAHANYPMRHGYIPTLALQGSAMLLRQHNEGIAPLVQKGNRAPPLHQANGPYAWSSQMNLTRLKKQQLHAAAQGVGNADGFPGLSGAIRHLVCGEPKDMLSNAKAIAFYLKAGDDKDKVDSREQKAKAVHPFTKKHLGRAAQRRKGKGKRKTFF